MRFIALLFLSLVASSQDNYIQVTVAEEIELKAREFNSILKSNHELNEWEEMAEAM